MKINFWASIFIIISLSCLCYAEPKIKRVDVNRSELSAHIPFGYMGYPLGTYLTIEGIRLEKGKVGTQTLLVDTVNGERLKQPVAIWINNVKQQGLPKEKRCIIRGFESGKMAGIPWEVAEAENLAIPQRPWQFERYFIITSVVAPKELEKEIAHFYVNQ